MKFKTTLLLSIFLFQQTFTIGFRIENWINNKTGAKVALIFDVHEETCGSQKRLPFEYPPHLKSGRKEEIISKQLEKLNSIVREKPSTKIYYEHINVPQENKEDQVLLRQLPDVINSERLIPSDKRPIVILKRIIENLLIALKKDFVRNCSDEVISQSLKNITIYSRELGVTNIKEIKIKIFELLEKMSIKLNEKLDLIEQNLEDLDLELIQFIEKINSGPKELKAKILLGIKPPCGLINYLQILSNESTKITEQNSIIQALDEMEQFIVNELPKNNFDSIVLVGGIHAAKISNYLKILPEFTLLQSHGPSIELPFSDAKSQSLMSSPPLEADQITL